MATFNKFSQFVADIANKVHNLGSDTLKFALSNTAPVATNTVFSNITEIASGNGYTAGGNAGSLTSSAQSSGLYKLVLANPATWTASGGSIGPFEYVVLYNSTASGQNLIGWWDEGGEVTIGAGTTHTLSWDVTNGILTVG